MRQNKIVRGLALALTCSGICFATSLAHVSANTVKSSAEDFSISNTNPDTGKEFKNAYVKTSLSDPTSDGDYYLNHFLFQYGMGPGLHYEATTESGGGTEVAVLNNWHLQQNLPKQDRRTLYNVDYFDTEGIKNLEGMIITYSDDGKVGGVFLPTTGNSDQNSGQVIEAYNKYGILGMYYGPNYVDQVGNYNANLQKANGNIGAFIFTLDYQSMPFFLHPGNYINVYPVFNVGAGKGNAPVKNGNMTGFNNANGISNVQAITVFEYELLRGDLHISPDAPNFPTPTESSSTESSAKSSSTKALSSSAESSTKSSSTKALSSSAESKAKSSSTKALSSSAEPKAKSSSTAESKAKSSSTKALSSSAESKAKSSSKKALSSSAESKAKSSSSAESKAKSSSTAESKAKSSSVASMSSKKDNTKSSSVESLSSSNTENTESSSTMNTASESTSKPGKNTETSVKVPSKASTISYVNKSTEKSVPVTVSTKTNTMVESSISSEVRNGSSSSTVNKPTLVSSSMNVPSTSWSNTTVNESSATTVGTTVITYSQSEIPNKAKTNNTTTNANKPVNNVTNNNITNNNHNVNKGGVTVVGNNNNNGNGNNNVQGGQTNQDGQGAQGNKSGKGNGNGHGEGLPQTGEAAASAIVGLGIALIAISGVVVLEKKKN